MPCQCIPYRERGVEILTTNSSSLAFRTEVKAMILAAVDKTDYSDVLRDDEPLFGEGSALDLDSLDGLQISMAIQKGYGIRMADSKEMRRVLTSLITLADYLEANRK